MSQRYPTRSHAPYSCGLAVVAVVAVLSLALNLILLGGIWYAYRQVVEPLRRPAADVGRALRQAGSEPFTLTLPISQSLPLRLEVPIEHTVDIRVDTSIPIDTTYRLEANLPVVGMVGQDIPIHLDVPVHVTVPVVLDTTVPVAVVIPISMTVPVVLDPRQWSVGADLVRLGTVLEGWGPQEHGGP